MPLVKTSAVLLAISLWGAWAFAPAAFAAGGPEQASPRGAPVHAQLADDTWQQTAILAARQVVAVIVAGYQKAPLLVVVLSALLVLPAVALASWIMRAAGKSATRATRQHRASRDRMRGSAAGPDVSAWPAQAWLSVEGEARGTHPVAGEMIRIGRHPDNEVWLTDTSVHRYHAVIHRTQDADFFITDLSGQEGNGIRINGTRRAQSQLINGDVIELGKARITFATAPI
jgi:FHA domain